MKILIVDDEPDILELMFEEFTYYGYSIHTAMLGNDAIRKILENSFDTIVSDLKMPDGMVFPNFVHTLIKKSVFFFVLGQADVSVEHC